MTKQIRIPKHQQRYKKGKRRVWKTKRAHRRKKRGKGKKRIVGKKPVKLYPIRDEFGQLMGFKRKK